MSSSRTSCWTGLLAGLPGGPSSTKQARPWPHHPWGRVVCPPDGGHHAGVGDPDEHWHGAFRVLVSPPDCLWRAAQVFSRPLRGPQVGGGPFHVDAGSVRCVGKDHLVSQSHSPYLVTIEYSHLLPPGPSPICLLGLSSGKDRRGFSPCSCLQSALAGFRRALACFRV